MAGRGEARSGGRTYQSVLDADAVAPLAVLREERYDWPGDGAVDVARYVSSEFAALEAARRWSNVGQMACRDQQVSAADGSSAPSRSLADIDRSRWSAGDGGAQRTTGERHPGSSQGCEVPTERCARQRVEVVE